MLYHVSPFIPSAVREHCPTPIPQLARMKARGHFSGHALVSIVRLTVETNIVTSKCFRCHVMMCVALVLCLFGHCQYRIVTDGRLVPSE